MTTKARMIVASAAVLAAASAGLTIDVRAQGSTPTAFEAVTLGGPAAKRAMTKAEINADTAEKLVRACVEFAREHNGGASVVVLSPAGYLVNAYRTDGQTPNNVDSAFHKARTALYMRVSTREALNRWNTLESQLVRSEMNLYLNPGGFPIVVDDQIIGAIGVGGAPGDELCAYTALTKVLGPQPPMAKELPFGGIGNEPPPAAKP